MKLSASKRLRIRCQRCAELVNEELARSGRADEPRGAVLYTGEVQAAEESREWEQVRGDDVLRSHDPSSIARQMGPFGSPERVAILYSLYRAEKTGQALCEETGLTQGQLYHHIKDLMYLGYIRQNARNRYDITLKGRQALLTIVAMIDDFARH